MNNNQQFPVDFLWVTSRGSSLTHRDRGKNMPVKQSEECAFCVCMSDIFCRCCCRSYFHRNTPRRFVLSFQCCETVGSATGRDQACGKLGRVGLLVVMI